MKKIIFSILIMALAFGSQAQKTTLTWSSYGNTLDTVSNTATKYASVQLPASSKAFSIVVKVTKISGTVAGKIYWQGSNNGTDYSDIDSVTAVDLSRNYSYRVTTPAPHQYYRASYTGSGTMSASVAGVAYNRQ